MPVGGYVITSDDVKNLAKVLRAVSPQLGREMRRAVREAARPVITDMKSTIGSNSMAAYGKGVHAYDGPSGPGGITAKMQKNIRIRVSGGKVRIYVPAAGSIGKIAASIDAGKPWRHPVMGNRKAWVSQDVPGGKGAEAFAKEADGLATAVADHVTETARRAL